VYLSPKQISNNTRDNTHISSISVSSAQTHTMLPRNSGYPNSWKCPISHDVMRDPVIVDASCGHTFERRSIEQWMQQNTGVENMTCPLCRSHLRSQHLAPNVGLRESIDMFYEYPSPSPIATSPLRRFHFRSHHVAANICLRESMEMPYEHPPPSPIGTSRPTEAQQQAVYPFASSNIRAGSMLGRNLSSEDAPLVVYQTVRGKWRAEAVGASCCTPLIARPNWHGKRFG